MQFSGFYNKKDSDILIRMKTCCVLMVACVVVMVTAQKGIGKIGIPPREKPGRCPVTITSLKRPCPLYLQEGQCRHDFSCPNQQKCCNTGCFKDCVNPIIVKPPPPPPPTGGCPFQLDIAKPCPRNPYHSCKSNRECPKGKICCLQGCDRQCVRPRY